MRRTALHRPRVWLALLALAVAGSLLVGRRPPTTGSPVAAGQRAPTRLGWVAGSAYRYSLRVRSEQHARPTAGGAGGGVDGMLDLAGDLVVRCYDAWPAGFRLGVSLDRLKTASVVVGGASVVPHLAALGGEAFVVTDEHGRLASVRYRKDAADAFRAVMPDVIALLAVTLPAQAAATWETSEATMLGVARTRYVVADEPPWRLARTRLGYDELLALPRGARPEATVQSQDEIRLGATAVPERLSIDERVLARPALDERVEARLELAGVTSFTPALPPEAELDREAPGRRAASGPVEEQMLRQLAGDMSLRRLEALAFGQRAGARLPPGTVTAAVAMLKLDPALCGALVEMFERPEASLATRALLLDLLASAGHGQAQAAMRDALSSPAARADATGYGILLQRLGMVLAPGRETVDFAYAAYTGARGDARAAAAFALGATLGARGPARADPALERYADRLRADLRAAGTGESRVALLAALGNAGDPHDAALIDGYAHDADAGVRRQAALSLRREHTPEARSTLFAMLGDPEASVGSAALSSLADEGLAGDDARMLAGMVGTPGLPGELNEPLLTVVGADPKAHPDETAAVLRAILATSHDPHTLARARMLLDRAGA
ncbi:MAG TPA: HEAT repeat domain-containing protein [Polyangiaceae bacterium]|jgi:hypothetical protein